MRYGGSPRASGADERKQLANIEFSADGHATLLAQVSRPRLPKPLAGQANMTRPEEHKRRSDELKNRLEAVRAQLDVPRRDETLIVDASDLDAKCRRYQEQIDRILQLPATPEIDDALGEQLVALQVAIDDVATCCRDLKRPLDRLVSAVYERLPDDPRYDDDAS